MYKRQTSYYDALPEGADKMDDVVQMTYVDAVSYFEENGLSLIHI